MIATIKSCTLVGIGAELVDVEGTIARGLSQSSEGLRQPFEERCVSIERIHGASSCDPTANLVSHVA